MSSISKLSPLVGNHVFSKIIIGKDKDYFIENVSILVASGINIISAFDAVRAEVKSKKMRKVIDWMKEEVGAGCPFWTVLESSGLFSPHIVSLVRIGEESGKLAENLEVVSLQQEKDRVFHSRVRSAMMYPLLVLLLTIVIGIGIAWFILPRLALVFSQLRMELPLATKVLISIGTFLGENGSIAVPSFFGILAILIYFVFFLPKTKFIGQQIFFFIPGIRQLIREMELARFGYLLGTLLRAGLPIVQAIDSVEKATVFSSYQKLYRHFRKSVEEGGSFQKSFKLYKGINRYIPKPVEQLIIAGEQSGALPEAFLRINKIFEARIETATKNLTVILEPILLVIVWMGVVIVALAVIMPIYSLIGGLKTQ
ncbi:MAG TPA: type II secretion system F family protein [Patescibacteria group bacterium]|nr:type II secretion system F family protein [Patescibacteria group bacterium]